MGEPLIAIPTALEGRFRGWRSEVAWDYNPQVTTYRLTSPGGELKVGVPSWWPSLGQECERMRWAGTNRPASEDLVVCHGDYCPPNILFKQDTLGGFVALPRSGCGWPLVGSGRRHMERVGWNLGDQYEPLFLQAYGAEPDDARCAYYRLLYDVAS